MPAQNDLERDIFGSDSELSDFDDDVPERAPQEAPAIREESSEESGDEYVQERAAPPPKRRSRRGAEGDEGKGKRASTKRKRKAPKEDIDLSQLPPEQAQKMRLDMQIEAILKPKKANRARRKKKDDEDVLDRFADEEVSRLRELMMAAAADDEQANRDKLPATAKLRLLAQVVDVLRKTSYAQSIMDNNLLQAVHRWLEPLPDKSLPALDIQKAFFPILKRLEYIDTGVLKESRLGRVILFYTKCKRVTPDIQRMANDLVSAWSRPIIKRSASYRDRDIPIAEVVGDGRSGERLNAILARAREDDKNRVRRNAVTIPQRELGSYTVAPKANAGISGKGNMSVIDDVERRKRNAERLRTLTRKIQTKA